MPASETALPLRIGARTLLTLRRRLVRRRLSLEEALGGRLPALPPLGGEADGYLVPRCRSGWAEALAAGQDALRPFVRQRYRRSYARLDQDFDAYLAGFSAKSRSTCRRKLRKFAERSGGALDLRCYRTEDGDRPFLRPGPRGLGENLPGAAAPRRPARRAGGAGRDARAAPAPAAPGAGCCSWTARRSPISGRRRRAPP